MKQSAKSGALIRQSHIIGATLLMAISLFGIGAAHAGPSRLSNDFVVSSKDGDTGVARAYFYGQKTVVELSSYPLYFSAVDADGNPIEARRDGKIARLAGRHDEFVASIDGKNVTFKAYIDEPVKPVKAEAKEVAVVAQPAAVQASAPAQQAAPRLAAAPTQNVMPSPAPLTKEITIKRPDGSVTKFSVPAGSQTIGDTTSKNDAAAPIKVASSAASDMAAPIAVTTSAIPAPVIAPVEKWEIRESDVRLISAFERWAEKAHYKVQWDADKHVLISATSVFTGTFEDAVAQVLTTPGIRFSEYPLEACVYQNNPPLLRITRLGVQTAACPN